MDPLSNPLLARQNELMYRRSMLDNAPVGSVGAPGGVLPSNAQSNYNPGVSLSTLATMTPAIGDLVGLALDAHMYKTQPETRTWGNYGLSALGALPFIPHAGGILSDFKVNSFNHKKPQEEFTLGENITPKDLTELFSEAQERYKEVWGPAKKGEADDALRILKQGDKVWAWPADSALHEQVIENLGIKTAPSLPIERGYLSRKENFFELIGDNYLEDRELVKGTFEDFLNKYVKKENSVSSPSAFEELKTKKLKDPFEVFDPRDGKPLASFASEEAAQNYIKNNPNKLLDYDKRPEEFSYSSFEKEVNDIAKALEKERKSKFKLVPKGDK